VLTSNVGLSSDVRLEAEAKALPRLRLVALMPHLGLNVTTSRPKLRYYIIIRRHNFHPFIFCIHVIKTFKTKLHLCIKHRF